MTDYKFPDRITGLTFRQVFDLPEGWVVDREVDNGWCFVRSGGWFKWANDGVGASIHDTCGEATDWRAIGHISDTPKGRAAREAALAGKRVMFSQCGPYVLQNGLLQHPCGDLTHEWFLHWGDEWEVEEAPADQSRATVPVRPVGLPAEPGEDAPAEPKVEEWKRDSEDELFFESPHGSLHWTHRIGPYFRGFVFDLPNGQTLRGCHQPVVWWCPKEEQHYYDWAEGTTRLLARGVEMEVERE